MFKWLLLQRWPLWEQLWLLELLLECGSLVRRWATSLCSGLQPLLFLYFWHVLMRRQAIGDFSKIFLNHDHLKISTNIAAHATLTKTIIFPGPKLMRKSVRGKQNDGRWRSRGVLAGTWRQWARMTSSPTFFPPFLGLFVCNQDWQWARMASFSSLFVCNQYW